jgi:hypothetical protein
VFTPKAAALFIVAGTGLYFYFSWEKQRLVEQKRESMSLQYRYYALVLYVLNEDLGQRRRWNRAPSDARMSVDRSK